jgi:hypothetical protein
MPLNLLVVDEGDTLGSSIAVEENSGMSSSTDPVVQLLIHG